MTKYHDLEAIPTYLTVEQIEEALNSFLDGGEANTQAPAAASKAATSKAAAPKAQESILDDVEGLIDEDIEAQLGSIGFGKK